MGALRFVRPGLGARLVDYGEAWDEQRRLHGRRVAAAEPDTVVLLEHPPVYTAGKRTQPPERPRDGTPVVDVDRGGKITWHGPGQLVGYPIVRLADHVFVVDYVRRLEEALIRTCAEVGVRSGRVPGRSGVWIPASAGRPDRKVAAIGVRVAQGVTMHGFAVNCDCDLSWYDRIVPCGITDATVTTLSAEVGRRVSVAEVVPLVEHHLSDLLSWTPYDRSSDLPDLPDHEPSVAAPGPPPPSVTLPPDTPASRATTSLSA